MGLITKETVDNLIEAYEGQITALKNEVEALKASQSADPQSNEHTKEAKLEGTTYDILQQLTRGAK